MIPQNDSSPRSDRLATLQAQFIRLLPRIELHARIRFRHVRCPARRDDLIQEVVAISWETFLRTDEQGKDPTTFVSAIARYAILHVRSHRRFCGSEKTRDALSPLAQYRGDFTVGPMSGTGSWEEALHENHQTPVLDQVIFRMDFPCWLDSLEARARQLTHRLMEGDRNHVLAIHFGLSKGRISQFLSQLCESWNRFHDPRTADSVPVRA